MKNLIKKLNRIFQDYMREKRLKIGKYIWDRKDKVKILEGNGFLEENDIKSILFLRYDGKIGDMVVNSLMFREIKKVYPNIKIGIVARGAAIDIIKDNPNVDKIYEYYKDRKKIKDLALKIKEEKYDLLIDFSEMLRVNQMMLINLCGARINIGLDRKDWKLFDLSIESGKDFKWTEHITNRYLAYLVKLGLKKENIDISYDIYLKDEKKYKAFFNEIKESKKLILNPYGASKHKSFNIETLENIITYLKDKDIAIILVYFGDKYIPITEMMDLKTYQQFLSNADIMVCNHRRQQAWGNLLVMLKYGKKVFIRSGISTEEDFNEYGLKFFLTDDIESMSFSEFVEFQLSDAKQNDAILTKMFSNDGLFSIWDNLFKSIISESALSGV